MYTLCENTDIEAWEKGTQIKYDINFINQQGRHIAFEIIKTPIINENGDPESIIVLGRDVTERELMTQALKEAKDEAETADKLKTAFLTNMSHELRTPLNGILGFSQLMKDRTVSEKQRENFLDIILNSSNHLLDIINDIIDFSKIESKQITLNLKALNFTNLFADTYKNFQSQAREKNLDFNLVVPENKNDIISLADKVRMQQILNNLLSNAFKFTRDGKVEMILHPIKNNKICFRIKDTGVGIPKSFHKIIFQRFRQVEDSMTREFGGAGLGLSITKNLVDMMDGHINLTSSPGKVSTFEIILPFKPVIPLKKPKEIISNLTTLKGKTILIVEDDPISYSLIHELLKGFECTILHAKNGKQAINKVLQNNIDLILMDIQMPIMDGFEATQSIKKINQNIPVIALTAHATKDYIHECKKYGCDGFISKPIQVEELFSIIQKNIMDK